MEEGEIREFKFAKFQETCRDATSYLQNLQKDL